MKQPVARIALVFLAVAAAGCERMWGNRIERNGGEVYFADSVTADEAERVADFLAEIEFFDGREKSVQLRRNSGVFQFRFVVMEGKHRDPEVQRAFQVVGGMLSHQVLEGEPVEVHLTDEIFRTVAVLPVTADTPPSSSAIASDGQGRTQSSS